MPSQLAALATRPGWSILKRVNCSLHHSRRFREAINPSCRSGDPDEEIRLAYWHAV